MSNLIIGNTIALIASLLMVYSGTLKKRKHILKIQTIQIGLSVVSNIVLGSITGAIINTFSCTRNILCYKEKLTYIPKLLLIFFATLFSMLFNNLGFIGFLPLISNIVYTISMTTKNVINLKLSLIVTMILWFVHDMYIKSYSSALFNLFNIIANLISIYQINKPVFSTNP